MNILAVTKHTEITCERNVCTRSKRQQTPCPQEKLMWFNALKKEFKSKSLSNGSMTKLLKTWNHYYKDFPIFYYSFLSVQQKECLWPLTLFGSPEQITEHPTTFLAFWQSNNIVPEEVRAIKQKRKKVRKILQILLRTHLIFWKTNRKEQSRKNADLKQSWKRLKKN